MAWERATLLPSHSCLGLFHLAAGGRRNKGKVVGTLEAHCICALHMNTAHMNTAHVHCTSSCCTYAHYIYAHCTPNPLWQGLAPAVTTRPQRLGNLLWNIRVGKLMNPGTWLGGTPLLVPVFAPMVVWTKMCPTAKTDLCVQSLFLLPICFFHRQASLRKQEV